MTLLDYALFSFVLLGSKILLGVVAVYLLLSQDPRCVVCDSDMLPIQAHPAVALLMRLARLERRWCIRCRRETLARRAPSRTPRVLPLRPIAKTPVR